MSILITGGLSEFTNHLISTLLPSKTPIIVLHNGSDEKVSKRSLESGNLTLVNMSSTDEEGVRNLIDLYKVKKVFDTSLTTSAVQNSPLLAAKTLLLGITAVLDAIRTSLEPPSLVLVSGDQVYGNSELRDETQPLTPVSFLGAAQMSVEAMVHSYAVSYRIPIVIGRISSDCHVASTGILKIAELAKAELPAEVFNIGKSEKMRNATGWTPENCATVEPCQSDFCSVPPVFLVFGNDSDAKSQFLKLVKAEGFVVNESSIKNLQEASDSDVWKEFYSHHPSHLIYFSDETDSFEGDCFTLRTNMATNLYFPWLLASIADKTSTHFTHFGDFMSREETSALAVKGFTQKMLAQFENTLRLPNDVQKNVIGLIKEKRTGGLNNNV